MRLYESFPLLYDRAVRILTGGDFPHVQAEIADRWVHCGEKILNLTSIAGRQAFLNARKGAETVCLASSAKSARYLSKKIAAHNWGSFISVAQNNIQQLGDLYKKDSFDIIQASFLLGKIKPEDRVRFMQDCYKLLKNDGTLILIDKSSFSQGLKGFFARLWEKPLAHIVDLLTGVKLVPVDNIEKLLDSGGFYIFEQRYFYFDALQLICAQKKQLA